jgi:hypothetical protein
MQMRELDRGHPNGWTNPSFRVGIGIGVGFFAKRFLMRGVIASACTPQMGLERANSVEKYEFTEVF